MGDYRAVRYLVIDTETTGIDHEQDRIVEVAATRLVLEPTMRIDLVFETLVNPMHPISPTASAVHHLTAADVQDAPVFETVWNDMLKPALAAHDVVVAHNAGFDRGFLPEIGKPWFDTLRGARHCWPDAPAHSNQVLRYWLGLVVTAPRPHRAGDDTTVTAAVLARLLQDALERGLPPNSTVEDLLAWVNRPIVVERMPFGKHRGVALTDIPRDYLRWALMNMTNLDADLRYSLECALGHSERMV